MWHSTLNRNKIRGLNAYLPLNIKNEIDFTSLKYFNSKRLRDKKLEKALIKLVGIDDYWYSVRYYYDKVDLDGDGIPEALVYLHGRAYCGTGGCTVVILKLVKDEYTLFSSFSCAHTPIIICNNKTKGHRDLIMLNLGGGIRDPYFTWVKYDGASYPNNATVEPKVMSGTIVEGIAILSDDCDKYKGIKPKKFDYYNNNDANYRIKQGT